MSELKITIPCNIGDTVYRKWTAGKHGKCLSELVVRHINIDEYGVTIYAYGNKFCSQCRELRLQDFNSVWWVDKNKAKLELGI